VTVRKCREQRAESESREKRVRAESESREARVFWSSSRVLV
jgi:hypothetical protein